MDLYADQENALLRARVEELEGRLAQLEGEVGRMRGEDLRQATVAGNGVSGVELGFGPLEADAASVDRGGDDGVEGVRMVAIEMLTAGYARDQIATYLRQTFAVEDPESLIAEVSPVAG